MTGIEKLGILSQANGGGYLCKDYSGACLGSCPQPISSALTFKPTPKRTFKSQALNQLILILLILCFALIPVNAEENVSAQTTVTTTTQPATQEVLWSWECSAEGINFFRYQLNGEADELWILVDASVKSVELEAKNGDVLYVQSSYDGITWSLSGSTTYIQTSTYNNIKKADSSLALRLKLAPYALAVFDFYNGHAITEGKTVTYTTYGLSTSLELDWTLAHALRLYPEASYAFVIKNGTVLAGQKLVHYFKLGAGIDGLIHLSQPDTLYLGLFGGVLASINNNKANFTPYFGARLGYERVLTEALALSVSTRVSISFYKAKQALEDSFTLLLEPVNVGLSYKLGGKQ